MIIWFDRTMTMHVDKMHDANNSLALAKYVPYGQNETDVVFKANAVINGHILLLTHTQVTTAGGNLIGANYWNTSTTIRKHFFKEYLFRIEDAIKIYLRGTKGYTGEIKLRFRVGETTVNSFPNYIPISAKDCNSRDNYHYATYVILEKKLQ